MTLQTKTLLIVLSCIVGTIGTIYLISRVIVTDSFQELENAYARDNTVRVQEALNNEINFLSATADIYSTAINDALSSGGSFTHLASKSMNMATVQEQLDLLLYFISGEDASNGWFNDPANPHGDTLPAEWKLPMSTKHPLYIPRNVNGEAKGLVKIRGGRALMVASDSFSTIIDGNPVSVNVLVGRLLDSSRIQRLARVSKLSLELVDLDRLTPEDENRSFYTSLDVNAPNPVKVQDASIINGYILLRDVENRPAYVLLASLPRDIYQQGQAVLEYFTKLLVIIGIVTVVIVLLLINQLVLSRLASLRNGMMNVYNTGDLTSHVSLDGDDELKQLVVVFNNLLDWLKSSQSELERQVNERIAAEKAIQISQERFNRAELIGKLGHWEWDEINARLITCSEQFALIHGMAVDQVLTEFSSREKELATIHPDDRERVARVLTEAVSSLSGVDIEYRIHTITGTLRHVQRISEPVINEKGELVRTIGTLQDITRQKQVQDRLKMYQNHLRSVMSKLALAEEQERRRIAAELHDSTIQDLGLLKFRLSAYLKTQTDNTTTGNLSEILATLDKAINDTRTLVFELSPPILYEIGFVPALEWLAEQFYRQRGLACKVIDDGRDKPLDTSMMVILFQIVRELLINISKHAGATSSSITIKRTGETVSIKVADNGKGFDADRIDDLTSQMEGFGLFSIRERLNSIEGEFSIESSPGKGTSITLSAPLMLEPVETV